MITGTEGKRDKVVLTVALGSGHAKLFNSEELADDIQATVRNKKEKSSWKLSVQVTTLS